jgi:hypothetical protein
MDIFLESIHVGWSDKYGTPIYKARIEHIDFARGFTEIELKELLRENLEAVGAHPFHVSGFKLQICCVAS